MRTAFGLALAAGVLTAAAARADDDKPAKVDAKKLVGKWEPADAPKGINATMEFTGDGKLVVRAERDGKTDKREGTYTLDGNTLAVTLKRPDGKDRTDRLTVTKLTDDEVVLEEESKKKSQTLKRVKDKK